MGKDESVPKSHSLPLLLNLRKRIFLFSFTILGDHRTHMQNKQQQKNKWHLIGSQNLIYNWKKKRKKKKTKHFAFETAPSQQKRNAPTPNEKKEKKKSFNNFFFFFDCSKPCTHTNTGNKLAVKRNLNSFKIFFGRTVKNKTKQGDFFN